MMMMICSLKVVWEGELPCKKWNCECAFRRQRSCCCASHRLYELEDQTFTRMTGLWQSLSQLGDNFQESIGGLRVAFTASMSPRTHCFGPFTSNVPIPYDVISLNHGQGYNPALGVFTAPRSGLYSSFLAYSKVGGPGDRMYYNLQLMRNGEMMASTWEDNWEDSEDSSSQMVLLPLQKGGQVYVELLASRQLCGDVNGLNTFSGDLLYSTDA
uniref:complement C1q-like protein 4 n=1 Tax=Centroberyx gerrardi TaxID=166262 RepID=UPI003AB01DCD